MRGRCNQYIISRLHDNGVYDNCFLGMTLIDFLEEDDDVALGTFLEDDDDDVKLS